MGGAWVGWADGAQRGSRQPQVCTHIVTDLHQCTVADTLSVWWSCICLHEALQGGIIPLTILRFTLFIFLHKNSAADTIARVENVTTVACRLQHPAGRICCWKASTCVMGRGAD